MNLSEDALFVSIPKTEGGVDSETIELDLLSESPNLDYKAFIENTYHLIQRADLTQQLKLWEIRLLALLFDNKLGVAKREAINLNNALFLYDNPKQPVAQSQQQPQQPVLIYPLPKNNNSAVPDTLLILLLRLKSVPNLNMLNELYKLTYQSRLKLSGGDSLALQNKLTNLSYDVIAVLSINKNYITLLNHLRAIQAQLPKDGTREQDISNTSLLLILIESLALQGKSGVTGPIIDKYSQVWDTQVNTFTKDSLVYVLQNINPLITNDTKPSYSSIQKLESLTGLLQIVDSGGITGRILCSTLGLWELSNNYEFSLVRDEEKLVYEYSGQSETTGDLVDKLLETITRHWSKYIHKVYGLE